MQYRRYMVFSGDAYDNPPGIVGDQPSFDALIEALEYAEKQVEWYEFLQIFDRISGEILFDIGPHDVPDFATLIARATQDSTHG